MKWKHFLLFFAIIFFIVLSNWNLGPTNDEPIHLIAGLDYTTGHIRLNFEHPPLVKYLSGLILRLNGIKLDQEIVSKSMKELSNYYDHIIYISLFSTPEKTMKIFRMSRIVPLIFFAILLITSYFFCCEILSSKVALFSIVLIGLNPNMIAHSQIVHTDIPLTAMLLLCSYLSCKYIKNKKSLNLIFLSICFGLTLLTKYSAILFFPFIIFVIVFNKNFKKIILNIFTFILITLMTVAFINGFLSRNNRKDENKNVITKSTSLILCEGIARSNFIKKANFLINIPLIGTYCLGFYRVFVHDKYCGGLNYFNKDIYPKGNPFYFPVGFLLKSPISFLFLLFISLIFHLKNLLHFRSLFAIIAIYYSLFSFISSYNIGIRHILPIYPFLVIFVLSLYFDKSFLKWRKIFYLFFILFLFETLIAFPNYLEYFNILIPEEKGQFIINDSNYDWGQKNYKLWKYSDQKKRPITCFTLSNIAPFMDDAHLGMLVPNYDLTPGYYAISSFAEALLKVYKKGSFKKYGDSRTLILNHYGMIYAPNLENIINKGILIKSFKSIKVYEIKKPIVFYDIKRAEGEIFQKITLTDRTLIEGYIKTNEHLSNLFLLTSDRNHSYKLYRHPYIDMEGNFFFIGTYSKRSYYKNINIKVVAISWSGKSYIFFDSL